MEIKYAITTFFYYTMDGQLIHYEFAPSYIKSRYALSYELANSLLYKSEHCTSIEHNMTNALIAIMNDLFLFKNLIKVNEDLSHAIIETFMVLTNKVIAETLCKHFPTETILRAHKSLSTTNGNTDIEDSKLRAHLNIITMQSAEYIMFDQNRCNECEYEKGTSPFFSSWIRFTILHAFYITN